MEFSNFWCIGSRRTVDRRKRHAAIRSLWMCNNWLRMNSGRWRRIDCWQQQLQTKWNAPEVRNRLNKSTMHNRASHASMGRGRRRERESRRTTIAASKQPNKFQKPNQTDQSRMSSIASLCAAITVQCEWKLLRMKREPERSKSAVFGCVYVCSIRRSHKSPD